jgi:hypothetical protein
MGYQHIVNDPAAPGITPQKFTATPYHNGTKETRLPDGLEMTLRRAS